MIPEIGLMIGFYIITKMSSLIIRTDEKKEHILVIIAAVITISVCIIIMLDLLFGGLFFGAFSRGFIKGLQ